LLEIKKIWYNYIDPSNVAWIKGGYHEKVRKDQCNYMCDSSGNSDRQICANKRGAVNAPLFI